jgi:hypothetical protein
VTACQINIFYGLVLAVDVFENVLFSKEKLESSEYSLCFGQGWSMRGGGGERGEK